MVHVSEKGLQEQKRHIPVNYATHPPAASTRGGPSAECIKNSCVGAVYRTIALRVLLSASLLFSSCQSGTKTGSVIMLGRGTGD